MSTVYQQVYLTHRDEEKKSTQMMTVWIPTVGTNKEPIDKGKFVYLQDDPRLWEIRAVYKDTQDEKYFQRLRNERRSKWGEMGMKK